MVLESKGQVMILGVMMFILAFMTAVLLVAPLIDLTDIVRDGDHLSCDNDTLSTGRSLSCVVVDLYLPYFIIAVIIGGATLLVGRNTGRI